MTPDIGSMALAQITEFVVYWGTPHASMCQHRAGTGPMLAASDQYRPGAGIYWNVYQVITGLIHYGAC